MTQRFFYMLLACLFATTAIWAQTGDTSKMQVIISGQIIDSISREPVSYATVSIKIEGEDASPYGQVTDPDGYFRIAVPRAKSYLLEPSFVGMSGEKRTYQLGANATTLDVGSLVLHASDRLETVKIVGKKPLVKMEIDRISYAMKDDKSAQSKDLLDMLRRVPLVTVDGDDNIQVKGSSSFKVFINGKPSPMFDKDPQNILRSIPASSVDRVEVITEPGVKYSSEGVSAIINLITATSNGDGYSASIRASSQIKNHTNGSIYFSAQKGRFGVTLNANAFYDFSDIEMIGSMTFDSGLYNDRKGTGWNDVLGGYGNLLLSYEVDSLNLITLTGSFRPYLVKDKWSNLENRYQNNVFLDQTKSNRQGKSLFGNMEAGIDYQHSTRLPGELLTLSYRYAYTPNNVEQTATYTLPTDKYSERSKSLAHLGEHTGQIDYVRPFGKAHLLEVGSKYIYRGSFTRPSYELLDTITGIWNEGSRFATEFNKSPFNHTYQIGGVYAAYTYRQERYAAKVGFRVEAGRLDAVYDHISDANFSQMFIDWIPDASISYQPAANQQLKLNYNFRLSRPSIEQLNPYAKMNTPYYIEQGNPELSPMRAHIASLQYSLSSSRLMLMTTASFVYIEDAIQSASYTKDDIVYSTMKNAGRSYKPALNIYASYTPTIWLRLSTNLNGAYTTDKNLERKLTTNGFSGMAYGMAQVTLPKNWTIDLMAGYYHGGRSFDLKIGGMYFDSYSVSKGFLKNQLNFSLNVRNPFTKRINMNAIMYGSGYSAHTLQSSPGRRISLAVSWRFGQLQQQVKRTKRTIENTDVFKAEDKTKPNT